MVHVELRLPWCECLNLLTTLCGRGLAPLALLPSRNLRPGVSARALNRVSMCGELLVKIAAAEIASLGHEDHVVDELLLELNLVVQSGFEVLESFLDRFSLEEPRNDGRVCFAVGGAKL